MDTPSWLQHQNTKMQRLNLIYLMLVLSLISCQEKEGTMIRQEKYIAVEDGLNLYVETYGASGNEACLFISGAGANSSFWSEHLCDSLVKNGFFVVKYDYRDFGYSSKIDWDKNPYNFMELVKDALIIFDSLKIDEAHVIGHSMGGFIVQLLGIHYPHRIISMTSISSSTNSPTVPMPPDKTWEIYLSNKPQGNFEADLDGFLKVWKYLNGTAKFDKELATEYTKNLYKRQNIDGAIGATHVKAQETLKDRTDELKKVNIPTLVMHGEEDYAVDKYGAIQTAESIVNAELILIPQMGHIPFNHEVLQRFENEIIHFLVKNKKSNN
jgi:pimeloyl-ACP methyl ester carboxylesterase